MKGVISTLYLKNMAKYLREHFKSTFYQGITRNEPNIIILFSFSFFIAVIEI